MTYRAFVGVDWASRGHAACGLDPAGRRKAEQLLGLIRSAPAGVTTGLLTDGCEATKDLDRVITDQLSAHPDGAIFSSFPHAGKINAAQLLAEWGDGRPASPTPESVAALAGMTPVTRESGEHRVVLFRWACNMWLRQAMVTFADNSRHGNPWAAEVYRRARTGRRSHPHAIRILGRARIRVMWRCWIDQQPYDPALHGNARQLTATPDLNRPTSDGARRHSRGAKPRGVDTGSVTPPL